MPEPAPAATLVPEPEPVKDDAAGRPLTKTALAHGTREAPSSRRKSETFKLRFGGHTHYATVGFYEDGRPCEVFFKTGQAGSTTRGYTDALGITVSHYLQLGGPPKAIIAKLRHTQFDPCGYVTDAPLGIEYVSSPADALAQLLEKLTEE